MKTMKKISIRCLAGKIYKFKEKAEKLNMTHWEYRNLLIENDLRDDGIVLNQKEIIFFCFKTEFIKSKILLYMWNKILKNISHWI